MKLQSTTRRRPSRSASSMRACCASCDCTRCCLAGEAKARHTSGHAAVTPQHAPFGCKQQLISNFKHSIPTLLRRRLRRAALPAPMTARPGAVLLLSCKFRPMLAFHVEDGLCSRVVFAHIQRKTSSSHLFVACCLCCFLACCCKLRLELRARRRRSQNSWGNSLFLACTHQQR